MLGYSNIRWVSGVDFSERSVELLWRGSAQDFRDFGYFDCVECSSLLCSGCGPLLSSSFRVFVIGNDSLFSESDFSSVSSDSEISAFVTCIYSDGDV